MPAYSYEIGTTSSTTNVESLATPVNPPVSRWQEYSVRNDRADGQQSGHGYPVCVWIFGILEAAMVTQLAQFCTNEVSATVYIKTRTPPDSSGSTEDFVKYSAVMIWPPNIMQYRAPGGKYINVPFEFRRLVAV